MVRSTAGRRRQWLLGRVAADTSKEASNRANAGPFRCEVRPERFP